METNFKQLGKLTRFFLTAGILLLLIGYLFRLIHLYFFWESTSIGWTLLAIAGISYCMGRIRVKRLQSKRTTAQKIFIGLLSFFIVVRIIFVVVVLNSDAFMAAKTFLRNSADIKARLGTVSGFDYLPAGSLSVSDDTGQAELNMIVKGEKRYAEYMLYVEKEPDTEWRVVQITSE